MCFQINTITTTRKPRITHCRQRNPNNLRTLPMSANTLLYLYIGVTSGAGPRAVGTERGRWSE